MKQRPTPEQQNVVMSAARLLVVRAFAGTGKTTTLVSYALARPNARILYLAYNKPIQMAAKGKFPKNVDCVTTHGLAFKHFGAPYANANKLGNVRPNDVMMYMRLDAVFAKAVLETVNNFIYSADPELTAAHVPASVHPTRAAEALTESVELWAAMKAMPGEHDLAENLRMSHDGYLKLYQLSNPNLTAGRYGYDVILADEWQDANPVSADIVIKQNCTRVLVGDSHQSIYGFRKSVDALNTAAQMPGAEVRYLTRSFRFGPDIASLATALLSGYKNETRPLIGVGGSQAIATKVDRSKQFTTICRTNASVFAQAVAMLDFKKVYFIGGVDSYPLDRLVDVQRLASGQLHLVKDPFFKQMGSLAKLSEYAKKVKDKEIGALLGVQKEFGPRIPGLVEAIQKAAVGRLEDLGEEGVQLTTAHRCKGLEFDQVVLADDFEEFATEDNVPVFLDTQELNEELNLLYVASTRASHAFEGNSSTRYALKALGHSGLKLPEGTQSSDWVKALMAGESCEQHAKAWDEAALAIAKASGQEQVAETPSTSAAAVVAPRAAGSASPSRSPAPARATPVRENAYQPRVWRGSTAAGAPAPAPASTPAPRELATATIAAPSAGVSKVVTGAPALPDGIKPWDRNRFRRKP
jgi:F-box protein 18 (helicase)